MSRPPSPHTIAIVGASGGLGASTLAAAVASRCAVHHGSATLVDLDLHGGGLEVTTGIEHVPGIRWSALAAVEGAVDPEQLDRSLPGVADVRVLSAAGGAPPPAHDAVADVLRSLHSARAPVVIDVPRWSEQLPGVVAAADLIVLVCGLRVRQLADADSVMARVHDTLAPSGDLRLVTRGRPTRDDVLDAVQEHLSAAHLGHWPDDSSLVRSSERGDWPGRSGATRRLADRIAEALVDSGVSAA